MVIKSLFVEGGGTTALKEALVYPLLNKPFLNSTLLENILPVSNYPFSEKMFEKVDSPKLQRALDEADYLNSFRSGLGHSTGKQHLLMTFQGIRMGGATILTLLNLSVAFSTVNHGVLLNQLRGLGGTLL